MRAGITLVEVLLAMTIMVAMLGVSIFFYRGEVDRTEAVVAQSLVRDLATVIERWQIENHRAWYSPWAPAGFPRDPWGHSFRVDPAKARFWSPGEDAKDDGGEAQKDLVGKYQAWAASGLESPRKVVARATGPDRIKVSWDPPAGLEAAIGLLVSRRADGETTWSTVATVSPTDPPEVEDLNAPPGTSIYYRVQALPGPASGAAPPASAPVGAVLPASPAPILDLVVAPAIVDAGASVEVKATGKAGGAPLSHLLVGGATHPVAPGEFSLTVQVPAGSPGTMVVVGELFDLSGARTTRSAQVQVY